MKRSIVLFSVVLLSLTHHSTAQLRFTDEELRFLQRHKTIVLGAEPEWEPMVIKYPDGTIEGFEWELLSEISELTGLEFELSTGVWSDLVAQAKRKEIDGLVYSSLQESRKPYFNFTKPYIRFKVGFYGKLNQEVVDSVNDLSGLKVGVQASDQFSNDYLDSLGIVTKREYYTRNQMLQALLSGEVDLVFAALDFNYYLWKNAVTGVRLVYLPENKGFDAVYSIRKDWPELVSIMNKALDAIGPTKRLAMANSWILPSQSDVNKIKVRDRQFLGNYKYLNLVTIPKWLPVVEVDNTGKIGGLVGDYIGLLNSHLHLDFRIIGTHDSLKIDSLAELPNTLFIYPDFERKKPGYYFSQPIIKIPYGLAMLKGAFFHDINSLGRIRVGVLIHNPHVEEIKKKYPNLEIVKYSSTAKAMDKILSGELDAYLGSISTLNYYIQNLGYSELFIAGLVDMGTELNFASKNETLIEIFDEAMVLVPVVKKQALIKDWYGGKSTLIDHSLTIQVAAIAFVILLFLAIWAFSLWRQIKKRKVISHELQENQANIMALIENTDAIIYSLDQNLCVIANNTAFVQFLRHFGSGEVEAGKPLPEALPEKYRKQWILRYTRALNGERFTVQDDIMFLGVSHSFVSRLSPIIVDREVVGLTCLSEDITRFTKLNQYMISLMENSMDYLFIKDKEERYVVASQSLAEMSGLDSWKKMIGKTDREIWADSSEVFQLEDERVLSGVHSINKEEHFKDAKGKFQWVQTTKEPIYNDQGEIIGLSGVGRNITDRKLAEQEQQMLIAAIESSRDIIFFFNEELYFIYLNPYGQELLGLEDYRGVHLKEVLGKVTYKVVGNALKNIVSKKEQWHKEFEMVNVKTRKTIMMDHSIVSIYDESGTFISYASVARDVTERNILQEQVLEAKLSQELMAASLKAEDRERSRIAHELHDGIQQKIATVGIYLQSLDHQMDNAEDVIQNSVNKLNETISDIRQMSNSLLPRALRNVGLTGAIQDEVEGLEKNTSINASYHENLDGMAIDPNIELNLYRIFQEAISNIIKYSKAENVEVQLIQSDGILTLLVEDDGIGFEVWERAHAGIGLSSIRNRAGVIGGHVEIDSAPDHGTSILVEVKL